MNQNFFEKNKYGIIFFTGFILTLLFTGGMILGQLLLGQEDFVVSIFGSVIFEQTTTNTEPIRSFNNFNLGFSAVLIGVLLMVLFKGYEKLNDQKNKDA